MWVMGEHLRGPGHSVIDIVFNAVWRGMATRHRLTAIALWRMAWRLHTHILSLQIKSEIQ